MITFVGIIIFNIILIIKTPSLTTSYHTCIMHEQLMSYIA